MRGIGVASFRKLLGRNLCQPSAKILVFVFPLGLCRKAPAMKTIRRAACLPKAAGEARPRWGSFLPRSLCQSVRLQLGEKWRRSSKTQPTIEIVVGIKKVVFLHRSVDMSNLYLRESRPFGGGFFLFFCKKRVLLGRGFTKKYKKTIGDVSKIRVLFLSCYLKKAKNRGHNRL